MGADAGSTDNDIPFRDRWKILAEGEQEAARTYDKTLITLSSAALAFSVLVSDKLFGAAPRWTLALAGAWIGFGCALAATLLSMLTTQRAWRRACEMLVAEVGAGKAPGETDHRNQWDVFTNRLNAASASAFILGAVALVTFLIANL